MAFDITIAEHEKGIYQLTPKGEINTQTYQQFEDRVKTVIPAARALVLDMSQVTYISSMGLSAVFRIKLAIEERGGTVALVNMQPKVQLVFETMKVLTPQMFASLQEADQYLDKFLDGVQKGTIQPRKPLE
ncbi:MAG TPA: STAS domain-containing protein [Candidatus Omnitrophota bacterium]|nr:STAS domain-containing protein [Candidatus Omnitrophota bacterium]HRZ14428.1 STAS domain-containing protein [Candidatus Omnitrophota bacterium]